MVIYGNLSKMTYPNGTMETRTYDKAGQLTSILNKKGETVISEYQYSYDLYSPYGELIEGTYGQVLFLYNGQYGVTSDDNSLYYMRARYYNIAIKRFCNQDILTGEVGESKSLNRYAYVEGNPVSYLDPFGLDKESTSNIFKRKIIESLAPEVKSGKTVSYGITATASVGISVGISVQLVMDSNYNMAVLISMPVGAGFPNFGISGSRGVTNVPSYEGLLGHGTGLGVGIGSVGADLTFGDRTMGYSISYGYGLAPMDAHGTYSYAVDIYVF